MKIFKMFLKVIRIILMVLGAIWLTSIVIVMAFAYYSAPDYQPGTISTSFNS